MNYNPYEIEKSHQTVSNFCLLDANALTALKQELSLSLSTDALLFCRDHFRIFERRDPTVGDLCFLDALSAMQCDLPDTAIVASPEFALEEDRRVFADLLHKAEVLGDAPLTLPVLTQVTGKYLSRCGITPRYEELRCGHPTELAALYEESAPALSLRLDGVAAAMSTTPSPSAFPATAICLLYPTGNAPFSEEVAQFFKAHRTMGLVPVAAPLDEGVFPHLLKLGGVRFDVSFFPDYRPDVGAASLLPLGKNTVLFLAPDAALPHLLAERAHFVYCGTRNGSNWLQLYRGNELLLSLSQRVLCAMYPCRRIRPTVGACEEKELARAITASDDTLLGGITATGRCEQSLLSLIGDMAAQGADLSACAVSTVLELPPMQNAATALSQALPLVLDHHRVLSELSLPVSHHRQFARAELSAPRLSVFIAAKQKAICGDGFAEKWQNSAKARDYAALRAVLRAVLYPSK